MWLAHLILLATTFIHPSSQQDGNTTAPFPNATYPNATSPNPAAQVNAQFSAPYYPSPWGSGAGDWASAYAKAEAFVTQLTLIEKINLTTGVGYVHDLGISLRMYADTRQMGRRALRWAKWSHTSTGLSKHVHAGFACGCKRQYANHRKPAYGSLANS